MMEDELLQIVKLMEGMQQKLIYLEQTNQSLIQANTQIINYLDSLVSEFEDYKDNAVYEINDPRCNCDFNIFYPVIKSREETISKIVNEAKSIARFGDGEFATIAGRVRHGFQSEVDEGLKERLIEVLNSNEERLLIGIADNYGRLDKYSEQTKREIRRYMKDTVRKEHLSLLDPDKTYYDAYITRPYVLYADWDTDAPKKRFEELKQIWHNRKCVFVEGEYTALGVGNDLFDNAKSIQRIIAPAENAFKKYDAILEACINQDKDSLFLLALGPTATVLAYDLCKAGYQAVDIGHVDLEYEWFLKGEGRRSEVSNKYNNEFPGGNTPTKITDPTYTTQILTQIL